jgi:hypothetical protein
MLKSIASKLVAVSTSAVLASAIIASSASALTVSQTAFHRACEFDSPQIALTSTGQVQGTGFCPYSTLAVVDFEDSVSSQGFEGYSYAATQSYPTVSADGTFTIPLVYSRPPGFHATTAVEVIAHDHSYLPEGTTSNTLIVTVPLLGQVL